MQGFGKCSVRVSRDFCNGQVCPLPHTAWMEVPFLVCPMLKTFGEGVRSLGDRHGKDTDFSYGFFWVTFEYQIV